MADTRAKRLPAGFKLLALAAFAAVTLQLDHVLEQVLCLALALGVFLRLGMGPRQAIQLLKPFVFSILVISAFTALVNSAYEGLVALLRFLALILASLAVMHTTPIAAFIALIEKLAMPLEKIGLLKASDLALAVGLAMRFLPEIIARYYAIRDAHSARGLRLKPLTLLGPLIISTLREADQIAAAIDARGIRRQ